MRAVSAVVLGVLLAPQDTHVHVTTPLLTNDAIEKDYGPPEVVELMHIAYNGNDYERKNVLTRGVLDVLVPGRYLSLREGAATVMVVPFGPGAYNGMADMVGRDVDLAGIVRMRHQQDDTPCRNAPGTCDNPRLPLLPGQQNEPLLPAVTITAFRVTDRGTGMDRGRSGGRALSDTGLDAAAADGKPVRAVGQFRGSNLCRDLPEASRRVPTDWVLLTSEGPVWVTGRRPEGKGFRLDPAYRADLSRWLEVGGRVEAAGEARYLKASKIVMIARPKEFEDTPCSP